jgi:hypothetical protein
MTIADALQLSACRNNSYVLVAFYEVPKEFAQRAIRFAPQLGEDKRAAVAIGHKILVATYHMLSQNVSYNDLGDLYLDKLNKHHLTRNLVHRL